MLRMSRSTLISVKSARGKKSLGILFLVNFRHHFLNIHVPIPSQRTFDRHSSAMRMTETAQPSRLSTARSSRSAARGTNAPWTGALLDRGPIRGFAHDPCTFAINRLRCSSVAAPSTWCGVSPHARHVPRFRQPSQYNPAANPQNIISIATSADRLPVTLEFRKAGKSRPHVYL